MKKDVDESLLVLLLLFSLLEALGKKLLSILTSSSDGEDDDAVELSSGSELESSSYETLVLVFIYTICCQCCNARLNKETIHTKRTNRKSQIIAIYEYIY